MSFHYPFYFHEFPRFPKYYMMFVDINSMSFCKEISWNFSKNLGVVYTKILWKPCRICLWTISLVLWTANIAFGSTFYPSLDLSLSSFFWFHRFISEWPRKWVPLSMFKRWFLWDMVLFCISKIDCFIPCALLPSKLQENPWFSCHLSFIMRDLWVFI